MKIKQLRINSVRNQSIPLSSADRQASSDGRLVSRWQQKSLTLIVGDDGRRQRRLFKEDDCSKKTVVQRERLFKENGCPKRTAIQRDCQTRA
ncbi:hypothetical protein [Heliomicrobium modesticaldum]|uniref:hypothetical protein n=1 Tax=Heliomicrobium modesticaldum TaxID=35701 RepID=UPI0011D10A76|nr:hypothetical protein [Heliomicrobium modesticaldum]